MGVSAIYISITVTLLLLRRIEQAFLPETLVLQLVPEPFFKQMTAKDCTEQSVPAPA